ncbi:MAG: prolipoprotein diacylglyceryl transferase [Bacteroidales bacterium]|nr:prolipoprotein diacylglyceryl transferase [Bacteroidales bacterium]MDT8374691.1 prolipoprotein diacylglyceryl transferase [Bacteroidales bacterium]
MDFLIIPWDVNPEIFRIGNFAVRWYGLLFASGFVIGYYIMKKIFANEGYGDATLDRLTVYAAIGTIVGARLGHCFFYEPAYYLANPVEILKVWHGGLASHGAAIGIPLALWFFVRKEKKPYIWAIDRVVIVVALAGALIRLGNLMNSEIYGVETTLPWGFVFLRNGETAPKHPTQIYESLAYLITFGVLMWLYWKNLGKQKPGLLFGIFLVMVFGFRFFVEFVKEDQVAFEAGMKLNMGQWLSIPFVLGGIALLVWAYRKKPAPVTVGKKKK